MSEQFTHFGTLQFNGSKVDNPTGQYEDSSITQVFTGYEFTPWISLQLNVPYINRFFARPEGFAMDRGTVSGFDDLSLLANYRAFHYEKTNFFATVRLLGGVKFPTGDSGRIAEELHEVEIPGAPESGIHGHDLALGSGSYDGIIGASFSTAWKRFFFDSTLQYSINSTGSYGYRYANALIWSGGPGYIFWEKDQAALGLQFVTAGERKGKDRFQGASADDTGITSVYLGPEIKMSWSDRVSGSIGVEIPVVLDNTSLQAVPDYKIRAGLTVGF